jgi:hypothetical protein
MFSRAATNAISSVITPWGVGVGVGVRVRVGVGVGVGVGGGGGGRGGSSGEGGAGAWLTSGTEGWAPAFSGFEY